LQSLGLNIVELLEIVRVCGSLQVEKCTPSYLSDYLSAGLAACDPDLATKIRRFDETELDLLADHIRGIQSSLKPHAAHRTGSSTRTARVEQYT